MADTIKVWLTGTDGRELEDYALALGEALNVFGDTLAELLERGI